VNKEIGAKKKAKEDFSEGSANDQLIKTNKENDAKTKAKQVELDELSVERDRALLTIGNLVHDSVPVHDDEANNEVVRQAGVKREEEGLLNHVDLFYRTAMSDTEKGSAIGGSRCYFLKGDGVLLNQAMINYGLAFLSKKSYTPLQTPFFMEKDMMAKTAQLDQFDEELYHVSGDGTDKYLIATSEQPISCYHAGEWLAPDALPIKYCGYSTCFRKEAGSHGRDTLGIFRIHQFEKVEQFCITSPDDDASWKMHEEMIRTSEEFYDSLGLHYNVVNIVSGELNSAAAKKFDLEAWFPASKTYRELVSTSNCTDYQSRRLEIRYGQTAKAKDMGEREKKYAHMLNGTLCATERAMCCLVENYQTPEGIKIPEVLQPYMLGKTFIPFVRELPVDKKAAKKK